jgi:hypothetical protein
MYAPGEWGLNKPTGLQRPRLGKETELGSYWVGGRKGRVAIRKVSIY